MSTAPKITQQVLVPTPVEKLFPGGEAPLEIPERRATDWKNFPVNAEFADYYLRSHADYLDHALSRLYQHSITFRGLLETRKDIATARIKVSDFIPYAPAFNLDLDKENPERTLMQNDPQGFLSLWMTAYKFRELQQKNSIVNPGETKPADIHSALALNRAVHADCSTFAASCFFETLRAQRYTEGRLPTLLTNTQHHWTLEAVGATSLVSINLLYKGDAQTLGFEAYLSKRNRNVVRALDQDFLTAAQALKGKKEDPRPLSEEALTFCFNALKKMPYLSGSGEPIDRTYLPKITFSEMQELDHTGLANRLSILRHRMPF